MRGLWYLIILQVAKGAYTLLGGYRGIHRERVPRKGPVILAPTHLSHLDPPLVACTTPRQLRFMAKEELFRGAFGWLIRSLGAFSVRRGEGDTESIRLAIAALEAGEVILIFPEGTRGDGKRLGVLSKGVAMIAKRTGAPVVPVAVVGTHLALPRGARKPRRASMRVHFGEPLRYADIAAEGPERENRERFQTELARRMTELSTEAGLPLEMPE